MQKQMQIFGGGISYIELKALQDLGLPEEEIEVIKLKREFEESWRD